MCGDHDHAPRAAAAADPAVGWQTQLIFVGRSLRHSVRNVDALMMGIALPVILMLLFVYRLRRGDRPSGGYVNYVVPGIILLCAGFGAAGTAVGVAEDMTNGVIDRFRTMPITSSGVITGHVVASLVRNLVATAVVIMVALLVGFRPSAGLLEWLGALGLVALWILAITWLFAALGLVAGSAEAAGNYGFALLFLPYLSSAFVPIATLPSWLRGFAEHQPITPVMETIRGLLVGSTVGAARLLGVGWCLLIIVRQCGRAGCFAAGPERADRRSADEDRVRDGVGAGLAIEGQEGAGLSSQSMAAVGAGRVRSVSRRPNRTSVACSAVQVDGGETATRDVGHPDQPQLRGVLVHVLGLGQREGADGRPPECGGVPPRAQRLPQVSGQRSYVGSACCTPRRRRARRTRRRRGVPRRPADGREPGARAGSPPRHRGPGRRTEPRRP